MQRERAKERQEGRRGGQAKKDSEGKQGVRMATHNVSAWKSAKEFIQECSADVLCLQETHLLDTRTADAWMRKR